MPASYDAVAKNGVEWVRRYLYYSTLLGIFSAILTFHLGFDVNAFEVLMLVNLVPMCLLVHSARIPAWMLYLIVYLAVSGGIGIAHGTDSIPQFAKEFLGISISLFYFCYFFKLIKNDFERAFLAYARISYWFAIIAIPVWVVSCIVQHAYVRLQGLESEPASFCIMVLPAYYWYAHLYFNFRKRAAEVIVFTVAIVLSASSLGYISVAFGVVLLLSERGGKRLFAIPILVGGLIGFAYAVSSDFRFRVDDTILALSAADVTGANASTYALISNVFVTQQVLKESPLIGNGLGSHVLSHARFLGDIPGVDEFVNGGMADLNASDAASFTLRCLSEFGIVGYLGTLIFLFRCHVGGPGPRAAVSNALLVCFFLKLIRGGMYFPPEQFFFIFIYVLNHRKYLNEIRQDVRHISSRRVGLLKPYKVLSLSRVDSL
jgi:hypothetical protein